MRHCDGRDVRSVAREAVLVEVLVVRSHLGLNRHGVRHLHSSWDHSHSTAEASSLLAFGRVVHGFVGVCIRALLNRRLPFNRLAPLFPVAVVLLIAFAPPYFLLVPSPGRSPKDTECWRRFMSGSISLTLD